MRILVVHNRYQIAGGEDQVFQNETDLLEQHGHEVIRFELHNDEVKRLNTIQLITKTVWNEDVCRSLEAKIGRTGVDIAHIHNTFPLISPAIYHTLHRLRIPVVQTLHNFRLLCPGATFFREGTACERCLSKSIPWPAVTNKCYRTSVLATGVLTSMLGIHRVLGTWSKRIGLYVALSEFARRKFVEGGMDPERIVVKPNSLLNDPGVGTERGDYFLYVGRVSAEKGLDVLLEAYREANVALPLRIAGDGPLFESLRRNYPDGAGIEWLGRVDSPTVTKLMKQARALVIPSVWYEGLPMSLVEAYAVGLPVIASDHGSLSELVDPDRTGLKFVPGDASGLGQKLRWMATHEREAAGMRKHAREEFLAKYTPAQNYASLMRIYKRVIGMSQANPAVEPSQTETPVKA